MGDKKESLLALDKLREDFSSTDTAIWSCIESAELLKTDDPQQSAILLDKAIRRESRVMVWVGGLFLGAMVARYFTGTVGAHWYILAVPIIALVGYMLGYFSADMSWAQSTGYKPYVFLASTPPHNLVRPLPIEYLAVGVSAALAGYWSAEKIEHVAGQEPG